jgi:Na+-transporting NADH:ubiquinone oxidoreductase subunit NqrB
MFKLIVKLKIYISCVLFFFTQLSINDPAVRPGGWDEIYSKYILKPHTNIVWCLNTSLLSILMFSRTPEGHVSVYSSILSHCTAKNLILNTHILLSFLLAPDIKYIQNTFQHHTQTLYDV